jgi:hypothetical protein
MTVITQLAQGNALTSGDSLSTQSGKPAPWAKVADFIPKGFSLTKRGVFIEKEDREFIAGPCWVSALTRSTHSKQSKDWGYVIHWIDQDGNEQFQAFPAQLLTARSQPMADTLHAFGLKVVPNKQRHLMAYLGSFMLPMEFRLQSVSKLGWLEGDSENPVYVLPNRVIGIERQEQIIFQPEQHSPTIHTMHSRGTLEQWQTFVAKPCEGNPVLVFSLSTAFSGSLLKFASLDCGGFHLYGASSKGKTTALQVAASVFGCGADPAVSEDSHIGRWNTTGNALEATAAAHNDGLLTLDELGTCDARNVGKVLYDLFGGKGKSRLNKNSSLQAQRTWRIMGLSTGELSVNQKIQEDTGKAPMTGQLVRMIDIPIKDGVIVDSHGKTPGEFADSLKKLCGTYYGTPGPLFIERLITLEPDVQSLQRRIQGEVDAWHDDLAEGMELASFQRRVLRRLAIVLEAGVLAVEFGLLPFEKLEIINAALTIRDAWLGADDNKPASQRGMSAVKDFILSHQGSRFRDVDNGTSGGTVVRDLAGYIDPTRKFYLFTDAGIREACAGYDFKSVLREMRSRGHLFNNDPGKLKSKHTITGIGRISLYAVKFSFIEADL